MNSEDFLYHLCALQSLDQQKVKSDSRFDDRSHALCKLLITHAFNKILSIQYIFLIKNLQFFSSDCVVEMTGLNSTSTNLNITYNILLDMTRL